MRCLGCQGQYLSQCAARSGEAGTQGSRSVFRAEQQRASQCVTTGAVMVKPKALSLSVSQDVMKKNTPPLGALCDGVHVAFTGRRAELSAAEDSMKNEARSVEVFS